MTYEPRSVAFIEREGQLKHYGIGCHGEAPRAALVGATRDAARDAVPEGALGFTIAHDAASAGLAIVYWWANDNEIHSRAFVSPADDVGALEPVDSTAMACVWELEVINFERLAWLEDVLKAGDPERYLSRVLEPVEV